MVLTIIIPALNEAANILNALNQLQVMRARGVEVIVVDGGSSDNTAKLAAPLCDQVVISSKGRAQQMNVGATLAKGDALLFLHADSLLPRDGDIAVLDALQKHLWGRFDVFIAGQHALLPMVAWFMNQRSRLSSIATGDQGIFIRRDTFNAVGGFANQPLMEDVEICKKLKKFGSPANVGQKITTSGRRWDTHGLWRTIWLMWRLRWQYFFGTDANTLYLRYDGK